MNKFITFSVFFCLPILLVISLFELLVRRIPTSYRQKTEWMVSHLEQTEIIVLGSSHGYYGINPSFFDKPTVNLANVSQTFKYDMLLLSQYIDQCPNLRYVILPVSYFSFFEELENTSEWWRIISYRLYMHCDAPSPLLKYNFEIAYPDVARRKFFDYYIKGEDIRACTDEGFGISYALNNRSENWDNGVERACNNTYLDKSDTLNNKKYIKIIQSLSANKGVTLVLVTTPTWHTFYENLDKNQQKLTTKFIENILATGNNVVYFNFLKDKRFHESDFYDADHLSNVGAEKLTRLLNDTLFANNGIY